MGLLALHSPERARGVVLDRADELRRSAGLNGRGACGPCARQQFHARCHWTTGDPLRRAHTAKQADRARRTDAHSGGSLATHRTLHTRPARAHRKGPLFSLLAPIPLLLRFILIFLH